MKLVKRIGLGLVVFLVGLVVLLLGSIIVDGFFAQGRLAPITNMSIPAADGATIPPRIWPSPQGQGPILPSS